MRQSTGDKAHLDYPRSLRLQSDQSYTPEAFLERLHVKSSRLVACSTACISVEFPHSTVDRGRVVKFESRVHTVFQNHKMKAKKLVQDMEAERCIWN